MIRVMVVDDQELIRQSLKVILSVNPDMEVVGIAEDGNETLKIIEECRPDVVLMDIRMPVMDGVECTARIKEKHPEIKVIALTTFDDDEFVFGALKNGASGYLLKGLFRGSHDQPQCCKQSDSAVFQHGKEYRESGNYRNRYK